MHGRGSSHGRAFIRNFHKFGKSNTFSSRSAPQLTLPPDLTKKRKRQPESAYISSADILQDCKITGEEARKGADTLAKGLGRGGGSGGEVVPQLLHETVECALNIE